MKDRSPCLGCKHRSPGCQAHCEIGKAYFRRMAEERERIRAEHRKENLADGFAVDRIVEQKKRMSR